MFSIHSTYDKDFMMDDVTVYYSDGFTDKQITFRCPASMSMEDYCSVMETAVNKMLTGN